ncbi:MAG: hypothetical protein QG549_724 [Patescibacteria group bacterium]|nr:hypothetical protein [Patescibacteria group bacterium]
MLKFNWKSPAIRMAMGMIIAGLLWCAGVVYAALGHPYEPFMLLFFSMGLMMSGAGAVYYVQAIRHERALDELIRKRNVEPGSIKPSAA